MFHIGTHVKVNAGVHHGKRGAVTDIETIGAGMRTKFRLTVTLTTGEIVSGYGPDFTPVPRVHK